MTLGWKVPKYSGGSAILGYYVDKREAQHENWHEVSSSPFKERVLTVGLSSHLAGWFGFTFGAEPLVQRFRVEVC